ncbi:hypothetical protein JXB22_06390 [candidate division WOR-3 bacterium]|nr:hypothetical protein [candidate division WOR-3 bacterium]
MLSVESGNALVVRSDDKGTTIAEDEVINDDVFLFGEKISIKGTINGDVVAFGSNITIDGAVDGTILAGGSNVTVNAVKVRSIWAGGSDVVVGAGVQNNVVIFGGNMTVTEDAVIGQDLKGFGGIFEVHGDIGGTVNGGAGTFLFSGTSDDCAISADNITIRKTAHIYGDLTVKSEKPADIEPGAIIIGEIVYKKTGTDEDRDGRDAFAIAPVLAFLVTLWKIIGFIAKLIVGIVIIAVFQRFMRRAMNSLISKPWISLLVGFLTLIILPIAIFIVLMLIIGFPFAAFGLFVYVALWYLAAVFISCIVGEKVIQLFKKEGAISLFLSFIVGFVIITILGLIPLFGFVLKLGVLLFGIGMILIALWELLKDMRSKELL